MKYQLVMLALFVSAAGCKFPCTHNLPPSERLMHPGPGVDGPGPGVLMPPTQPVFFGAASQIGFEGPEGMIVTWDVSMAGGFDSEPLICPGRVNFPQGAIYRLKLTSVPGRPGVELYPTLEVGPAMPRTEAYLAHNSIPVQFTEEDFDQILTGNFVTKVIYLPDAEFQELAIAGVETLVSTRLDPGVDPIVEADERGSILAIVRLGNKDLQLPGMEGEMMDGVTQASYMEGMSMSGCPMPVGGPMPTGGPMPAADLMAAGPGNVMPMGPISGVTTPQYGMTMSGTPIGLPGPPHVPHGIPAGLRKHKIVNWTFQRIPKPTRALKMHVRQKPGFSYPRPPSRVFINESTVGPPALFNQSIADKRQLVH